MKMLFGKISILLATALGLWNGANAQQDSYEKYYSAEWKPVNKENAVYKNEIVLKNNLLYKKTFDLSKNYLMSKGRFRDTSFFKPVGELVNYTASGNVADSMYYNDSSQKIYAYHYYENGKLKAEYHFEPESEKETVSGYDENGNKIAGEYIYEREADFPGGIAGWRNHIVQNLNPNVPVRKKAKEGTYKVVIRFIVSANGVVSDIEPETSLGYGMEEEAIRVIKKSPRWLPAIQFNKPVNAYRRQPVTFVVQ